MKASNNVRARFHMRNFRDKIIQPSRANLPAEDGTEFHTYIDVCVSAHRWFHALYARRTLFRIFCFHLTTVTFRKKQILQNYTPF